MLVIRLQRRGKTNQPFYKIVVTDKRNAPKAGVSVEEIGFINPITKEKSVNKERALHWLSVGAQPSDTIHNLLVSEGVIKEEKRKITVKPCKNPEKRKSTKPKEAVKEEPKAEVKAEEAAVEEVPKEEEPKVEEVKEEKKEEPAPVEEKKEETPKEEEKQEEQKAA